MAEDWFLDQMQNIMHMFACCEALLFRGWDSERQCEGHWYSQHRETPAIRAVQQKCPLLACAAAVVTAGVLRVSRGRRGGSAGYRLRKPVAEWHRLAG